MSTCFTHTPPLCRKDHSCHRCWGISWAYLQLNPHPRLPSSLALWKRPDLAEIMKQLLHLAVLHVAAAFPWQPGIFWQIASRMRAVTFPNFTKKKVASLTCHALPRYLVDVQGLQLKHFEFDGSVFEQRKKKH